MKNRIFLLEDDAILHETLKEFLEEAGYDVTGVYDGDAAEDALYETTFDVLLLDVNVPGKNGYTVLREARERGVQTPALFLTTRDTPADVESGFESGADDYVRKPFELKELLLRVRSMLRRRFSHPQTAIDLGEGITYDAENNLVYRDGDLVKLAEKPAKLLALLVQRRGEVISHETIVSHLWGFEESASDAALRTYIKILRNALGKTRIISHKRTGYQFR